MNGRTAYYDLLDFMTAGDSLIKKNSKTINKVFNQYLLGIQY